MITVKLIKQQRTILGVRDARGRVFLLLGGQGWATVKLGALSGRDSLENFRGRGSPGQLFFPGTGRGVHPGYLVNNCQDTFPHADLLLGVPVANPG